ncbi:MAG: glycosyltransferase family 4 protein [Candidatus Microgenomates bacterium]|jgi:glycosyltransferase involved in cell wall biosynthesis
MRAAIYNPYLDTLGGGERYTTAFARVLVENGYMVDLEWKDIGIKEILENRFGIDLSEINIVKDIKRGDGYDLCFWVSDGSIPTLRARKNILHFQVPFHNIGGKSLLNRMKLFRINKIVCNSNFTKSFIDREYGVNGLVIYPPIDVENIKPKRKENVILFVGRFSHILQNKGQEILIRTFKKLFNEGLKDWKLILAGGAEIGAGDYLKELKDESEGYPIEFVESPDFKTLKDLYGKAKVFWSASGFGVNEDKNPEKVEHFGITVVEALAAGAVPIIFDAGGHEEIVQNGVNGFLWKNEGDLRKITMSIIEGKVSLTGLRIKAQESSKKFGYKVFGESVLRIL